MALNRRASGNTADCVWVLELDCPGSDHFSSDNDFDPAFNWGVVAICEHLLPQTAKLAAATFEKNGMREGNGLEVESTLSYTTPEASAHVRLMISTTDISYEAADEQKIKEGINLVLSGMGLAIAGVVYTKTLPKRPNPLDELLATIEKRGMSPVTLENLDEMAEGLPPHLKRLLERTLQNGYAIYGLSPEEQPA